MGTGRGGRGGQTGGTARSVLGPSALPFRLPHSAFPHPRLPRKSDAPREGPGGSGVPRARPPPPMTDSPPPAETPKPVAASRTTMNEIVLPNDTNGLGNLMGGRLLHLMDICAAIAAQRHSEHVCVTASVDNVEFHSPIYAGEVVVLDAQVNRAFRTSMEIEINVWAENPRARTKRKSNRAYYTFVALDDRGQPVGVPAVAPETDDERARFEGAGRRRELRLFLAGRLPLRDAQGIMALVTEALGSEGLPATP